MLKKKKLINKVKQLAENEGNEHIKKLPLLRCIGAVVGEEFDLVRIEVLPKSLAAPDVREFPLFVEDLALGVV
jgi:hypothetical protein